MVTLLLLTNIGDERSDKGGDGGAFGLGLRAGVRPVEMMQVSPMSCLSRAQSAMQGYRVLQHGVILT